VNNIVEHDGVGHFCGVGHKDVIANR